MWELPGSVAQKLMVTAEIGDNNKIGLEHYLLCLPNKKGHQLFDYVNRHSTLKIQWQISYKIFEFRDRISDLIFGAAKSCG